MRDQALRAGRPVVYKHAAVPSMNLTAEIPVQKVIKRNFLGCGGKYRLRFIIPNKNY